MTTKKQLLSKIRLNCIQCMGSQSAMVYGCTSRDCEFFPYRMGEDPTASPSRIKHGKKYGFGAVPEKVLDDENQRTDPNP